jgi:hypothetical protein
MAAPEPRLVVSRDRPFVRDYSHWWRLPPPLPPGDAFATGLLGLGAIVGLILVALVFSISD